MKYALILAATSDNVALEAEPTVLEVGSTALALTPIREAFNNILAAKNAAAEKIGGDLVPFFVRCVRVEGSPVRGDTLTVNDDLFEVGV